jgi:hypothetical protein
MRQAQVLCASGPRAKKDATHASARVLRILIVWLCGWVGGCVCVWGGGGGGFRRGR